MIPNPFERDGKWYWIDETGDESEPYATCEEANHALLQYCAYLEGGAEAVKALGGQRDRHMNWDRRPASAFRRLARFFHNRLRRIAP